MKPSSSEVTPLHSHGADSGVLLLCPIRTTEPGLAQHLCCVCVCREAQGWWQGYRMEKGSRAAVEALGKALLLHPMAADARWVPCSNPRQPGLGADQSVSPLSRMWFLDTGTRHFTSWSPRWGCPPLGRTGCCGQSSPHPCPP